MKSNFAVFCIPLTAAMLTTGAFLTLVTNIRFIAPPISKHEWSEFDKELKVTLEPIHFRLKHQQISPQEAGTQFFITLGTFLKSKPEFVNEVGKQSHGLIKHVPKTLSEAKTNKKHVEEKAEKQQSTRPK